MAMKILALNLGKFKNVACIYHRYPQGQDSHDLTALDTLRRISSPR